MARQRNRQPGPIKRTLVQPAPTQPVSRNLGIRVVTPIGGIGSVRRSRAVSMATCRSNGEWGMSTEPSRIETDRRWSQTVSTHGVDELSR